MKDLECLSVNNDSWIITLLAASGANEPEYPAQIHLGYGNKKGDSSFDSPSVFIHDKGCAKKLFEEIEDSMTEEFGINTELQQYHDTSFSNIFVRQLNNAERVNSLMIRIAWSCTAWDSRRMLIAKSLADIFNRIIQTDNTSVEDSELKIKGIGFNDYLN